MLSAYPNIYYTKAVKSFFIPLFRVLCDKVSWIRGIRVKSIINARKVSSVHQKPYITLINIGYWLPWGLYFDALRLPWKKCHQWNSLVKSLYITTLTASRMVRTKPLAEKLSTFILFWIHTMFFTDVSFPVRVSFR